MSNTEGLIADKISLGDGVSIGADCRVQAREIELGAGASIASGVRITCDSLRLGPGVKIGKGSDILCPEIDLAQGCSIGKEFAAELNHHLILGENSTIGHRVAAVGQGIKAGRFLWLKNDVLIGGGGARGPDSYLEIGDRTSVFDKCFINLSERVTIGSGSALSFNVVLLTHGAWQSPLEGYGTKFAPIIVGDDVVVYLNSSVMPGVSIGNGCVIGAGSIVLSDVPANSLAAGNPAKVIRGPGNFPASPSDSRRRDLVREILEDFLKTLPSKEGTILKGDFASDDSALIKFGETESTLIYKREQSEVGTIPSGAVVVSFGLASQLPESVYHLDLAATRAEGTPNPLGEDLRDYLRRRGIRIFSDAPFRTLPLTNLARLKQMRADQS